MDDPAGAGLGRVDQLVGPDPGLLHHQLTLSLAVNLISIMIFLIFKKK